jgi:hypothetical protein
MLFFAGIFFCIIGIVMFVRVLLNNKRPRIPNARILEVTNEVYEYTSNVSQRKVPHANVEYYYQSEKYEKKILLKSKSKEGDTVTLILMGTKPTDVEEYYPKRENLAALLLFLFGLALSVITLLISDHLF